MNMTTLRHDPPEPQAEADMFSTGTVFTVICGQAIGEITHHAYLSNDGTLTLTYTASMDGCGELGWQEDPARLRQIGAVARALADELEARAL